MIYTQKINRAIQLAVQAHEIDQKQKRKGKDVAYIIHPLNVGLILSLAGASEDVVVAGILHDTIEDSIEDKKVTLASIIKEFGDDVAQLVMSVTEQDKSLSWRERKESAINHIKDFSHESLLIKSADVISNVSELLVDYKNDGDKTFERFNASKEELIKNQLNIINAIHNRWEESPLGDDLLTIARDLQMIGAPSFMSKKPAFVIQYCDYKDDIALECPVCNWKGSPESGGQIDTDSEYCLSVSCPVCEKMLLVAEYPLAN